MTITLNGTTGITTPDIDSTAGFDGEDLTGDVATARITGALNATGSAPIYACRAWVNFNGTGTVAIRASGNVSSISDTGVGDYTVNFTTAMPDVSYSMVCTVKGIAGTIFGLGGENHDMTRTASAIPVSSVRRDNGASYDTDQFNVSVFR